MFLKKSRKAHIADKKKKNHNNKPEWEEIEGN